MIEVTAKNLLILYVNFNHSSRQAHSFFASNFCWALRPNSYYIHHFDKQPFHVSVPVSPWISWLLGRNSAGDLQPPPDIPNITAFRRLTRAAGAEGEEAGGCLTCRWIWRDWGCRGWPPSDVRDDQAKPIEAEAHERRVWPCPRHAMRMVNLAHV